MLSTTDASVSASEPQIISNLSEAHASDSNSRTLPAPKAQKTSVAVKTVLKKNSNKQAAKTERQLPAAREAGKAEQAEAVAPTAEQPAAAEEEMAALRKESPDHCENKRKRTASALANRRASGPVGQEHRKNPRRDSRRKPKRGPGVLPGVAHLAGFL